MKKTDYLYSALLALAIIVLAWFLVSAIYLSVTHPELTQMQVVYTVLGIGGY